MRIVFSLLGLIFITGVKSRNTAGIDSLQMNFYQAKSDSSRFSAARNLYDYYEERIRDSALYYANECFLLAGRNQQTLAKVQALDNKAYQLNGLGRYADALSYLLEAFKLLELPQKRTISSWELYSKGYAKNFQGDNRLLMLAYTHHIFGQLMWQTDNIQQTFYHFGIAKKIATEIGHPVRLLLANMNLSRSYTEINRPDTALKLLIEAERTAIDATYYKYLGNIYVAMGNTYCLLGDTIKGKEQYYRAINVSLREQNLGGISFAYNALSRIFTSQLRQDSALYFAKENLSVVKKLGTMAGQSVNLGAVYESICKATLLTGNKDSILKYQGLTLSVKDSIYKVRIKNLAAFQSVTLNQQLELQKTEKEKLLYVSRVKVYTSLVGVAIVLIIAFILYRNNLQKRKTNNSLVSALTNLKSAQTQLIHAEKMASLGELTAGIAHEIQNPLNFVNNFSDLSKELIDEMNDELERGDVEEAKFIAADIKGNLEKINHHGKRADSIVRGMLQHSRSSSGEKQETDINKLADEYLRLSYHGLRSKDKDFNADIVTNFDDSIGKILIAPQEIGRVILNLVNNAFYVVHEKSKTLTGNPYKPCVTVTTKRNEGFVSIQVSDNGNGIPQKIKDKIFQPFFTTKPTGQGTGLGLSLSYDIVKAHGGEIAVDSKEGEGTFFKIQLPIA